MNELWEEQILQQILDINKLVSMCGGQMKSNSSKYHYRFYSIPYIAYECLECNNVSETNGLMKYFYVIAKNLRFCGKFSLDNVIQNSLFMDHLRTLSKSTKYIICQKCNRKFELEAQDNELHVYEFDCSHSEKKTKVSVKPISKPCFSCRKLSQRKCYQRCKKCDLAVLFVNQDTRVFVCPRCKLKSCEFCQKELTIFSTKFCHCKIQQTKRQLKICYLLMGTIILTIIAGITGSYFLEHSKFYQSLICTMGDLFQNELCTYDQFVTNFKKMTFLYFLLFLFMFTPVLLIEEGKVLLKLQNRLFRAECFKRYVKDA